jgi:hypothetical protein
MGPLDAVQRTREQLAAMLGRAVETVTGVDSDGGNWIVTAQVVELARIPNTTDVLAEYEVMLNKKGQVMRFKRTRRLHRGETDGGDSS